ncbi:hypothetical protein AVEN_208276-1 [Araneus ventricosus]|uniref:Uncharacterized protein n=1 Tax=Araneus ventricosus TaxID=182803 RepID=A0A4Y2RSB0_ARAVE|nr:hypothetical protein AVEN_208276-1 [Araneus ventricosus]
MNKIARNDCQQISTRNATYCYENRPVGLRGKQSNKEDNGERRTNKEDYRERRTNKEDNGERRFIHEYSGKHKAQETRKTAHALISSTNRRQNTNNNNTFNSVQHTSSHCR